MSDKHKIALWKNDRKNKETHPDMTGSASCPCCNAELRVAIWARQADPNKPKLPRLSGELEPAEDREANKQPVSNDLLDEVLDEVGTVEQAEAKARPIKQSEIPF